MLTLNAADEPERPGWTFHYPTNAAATPQTSWLRTDRSVTIPITRTVAASGNPRITYIFPFEERA